MAEALKDPWALQINVNADSTSRVGAFNTATISDLIESSTDASPIELTMTSHTFVTGDEVFIYGHLVNTNANGVYTVTKTGANTVTLDGSRATGGGAGGATGTVLKETARWIPCYEDGFVAAEQVKKIAAKTQHRYRGTRYSWPGHRNRDTKSFHTPIYPENAKLLLNLPLDLQSGSYTPKYYGAEQYVDLTLGTGTANFLPSGGGASVSTGQGFLGLLFSGWTLTFDRESEEAVDFTLDFLLNQETALTASFPSIPTTGTSAAYLGWPAQNPYRNSNVWIDLEFALADGTFTTGWTGDRQALQSASLKYSAALDPKGSVASTTPSLSGTWNRAYAGDPEVGFQAKVTLDNSDYLRLTKLVALRQARVRFMTCGDNPSGSTTSTTNLSANGTSIVLTSATGFHVGDVLLLEQPTAGKVQVVKITALVTTTATITAADVAMNGGTETISVRNTAWMIKVPQMDIEASDGPTTDGNVKAVNITGSGKLLYTGTALLTLTAYNDDNSGYPTT